MLWAGTEINLGAVTACLPSLRPIYLLITKGTAQPDESGASHRYNDSHGLRSKATVTFGSRSRTVNTFSGVDAEDKHHPFSIINDHRNILAGQPNSDDTINNDSNVDLEELQPPQDKVMVREDFSVNYSSV